MEHTLVAKVDAVSDERAPLFAVSFTNGELDTTQSDKIGVKAYQHRKSETTRKLVVRAGDMEYGGNFLSTRDEGKYLGVEDPETGEMTILPLKYIRLRPAVSITQEVEEELPPAKKTRQEQNDSLIDTFGGAKQKQNMLRRKKHGINSEMIYDALDAAGVEEMSVSAPSTPATPKVEADEGALPPHDTETTDPDKAYPLDGYLPERIRTELLGFVDDICDVDNDTLTAWKASKKFPQFIINQLENLPLAEHQRKSTAVLVKYLSFLLKLYKMKVQALRVKDPFHTEDNTYSMPASCLTHLMANYTTGIGKGRTVSTRLKDKILVAILLLSLRLERNTLPCNIIMSDLGVGMKKILDVSRAMGLKVKQDKSGEVPIIVVQLVAPLTFPTSRNTPRPKKRS